MKKSYKILGVFAIVALIMSFAIGDQFHNAAKNAPYSFNKKVTTLDTLQVAGPKIDHNDTLAYDSVGHDSTVNLVYGTNFIQGSGSIDTLILSFPAGFNNNKIVITPLVAVTSVRLVLPSGYISGGTALTALVANTSITYVYDAIHSKWYRRT